jgi:hypothetical protein
MHTSFSIVNLMVVDLDDPIQHSLHLLGGVESPPVLKICVEMVFVATQDVALFEEIRLLAGGIVVGESFLKGLEGGACQLKGKTADDDVNLRSHPHEIGQEKHLPVLADQHVVHIFEEVRVFHQRH